MKNKINITFLGTAANGGVPQVDCRCANCRSNTISRKRNCILIEINEKKVVIDCGPDFHSQLINNNLRLQDISGIIISHLHWDHAAGLFDLSSGQKLHLPIFVHTKLEKSLMDNANYNFIFNSGWATFSSIIGFNIKFIEIRHDPNFPTFAIKISNQDKQILIATDIWKINQSFINEAGKSDLIIFDSTFLDKSDHWHISIKESTKILEKINRNVIFTHINHSENPKSVSDFLNKFKFKLAFDGMKVKL